MIIQSDIIFVHAMARVSVLFEMQTAKLIGSDQSIEHQRRFALLLKKTRTELMNFCLSLMGCCFFYVDIHH